MVPQVYEEKVKNPYTGKVETIRQSRPFTDSDFDEVFALFDAENKKRTDKPALLKGNIGYGSQDMAGFAPVQPDPKQYGLPPAGTPAKIKTAVAMGANAGASVPKPDNNFKQNKYQKQVSDIEAQRWQKELAYRQEMVRRSNPNLTDEIALEDARGVTDRFTANQKIRAITGKQVKAGEQAYGAALGAGAQLAATLATGGAASIGRVAAEAIVAAPFGFGEGDALFAALPSFFRGSKQFMQYLKAKDVAGIASYIDKLKLNKAQAEELKAFMDAIPSDATIKKGIGAIKDNAPDYTGMPDVEYRIPTVPANPVKQAIKDAKSGTTKTPAIEPKVSSKNTQKTGQIASEVPPVKQSLTTEPPKPVETGTAPTTTPKTTPKPLTSTESPGNPSKPAISTGLANQVQDRELASGVLGESPKGTGSKFGDALKEGESLISSGLNPRNLAKELADKPRAVSKGEIGALTIGKQQLLNERIGLLAKIAESSGKDRDALVAALDVLETDIKEYVQGAQRGKTELSDAMRALQEGVNIEDGTLAEVIQYRTSRTGKEPSQEFRHEVEKLIKERDALKVELKRYESQGTKAVNSKTTVDQLRQTRFAAKQRIRENLSKAFKSSAGAGSQSLGLQSLHAVFRASPEIAKDAVLIIKTIVQEHKIKVLDAKFFNLVRNEIDGITDDEIRGLMSGVYSSPKEFSRSDFATISAQAQRELTEQSAKAAIGAKGQGSDAILATTRAMKDALANEKVTRTIATRIKKLEAIEGQIRTGILQAPGVKSRSVPVDKLDLQINLLNKRILAMAKARDESTVMKGVKNVTGTLRWTKLGADFGVILRQGYFGLPYGRSFLKSISNAAKHFKSEADVLAFDMAQQVTEVRGKLMEPIRRKAGLNRSDYWSDHEELVASSLMKRIPVIGKHIGKLDRGQVVFLNSLRNQMFDDFYIRTPDATPKQLEEWANYVNSVTGRSNAKRVGDLASTIFTSPRYERSRWEVINHYVQSPITVARALKDPVAREKLKSLGATAAITLSTLKGLQMSGWEVHIDDPTDTDFLKARKGDLVIDITGGLSPRIRSAARILVAFFSKDDGSRQYNEKKDIGKESIKSVVRAVSPGISTPVEMLTGRDLGGWKPDEDEMGLLQLAPLIISGAIQGYKAEGIKGASMQTIPEFFGVGTNRYDKPKTSDKNNKPTKGTKQVKKTVNY